MLAAEAAAPLCGLRRLPSWRRFASEVGQFPEAPSHSLAPIHCGPAHLFDKVDKLGAQPGIQNAEPVARILEIEQQHRARGGATIPRLVLVGIAEDERAAFLPGSCFINDAQRAIGIRLEREMQAEDIPGILVVTDVRLDVRVWS